jgi:glycosyltransferase involved in cell wall biosynthesis
VAAYLAWTAPIAEALRQRVDSELVSVVPPSVELPAAPRRILEAPERSITITIIGGGRDMSAYAALLAALSAVARETPQLQAAIELRGPHAHDICTGCDVLLMPERYGEVATLPLQAMAEGMAIVAAADGALDMLVDGQTALLTEGADTEGWLRHLRRLLQDPPAARRLGDAARRRVQAGHLCAHQVEALTRTVQGILSGGAYRLGEAAPA